VTVDEIIEKLEENQEKIEDITADVVMRVSVAGKIRSQEVKMWCKGDKKMRTEFVSSEGFTANELKALPTALIMNGSKMSIKKDDKTSLVIDMEIQNKENIIKNYLPKSQSPIPGIGFQKGISDFLKSSEVSIEEEEGSKIKLLVIPKESDPIMQKSYLVVDMEKGVVNQFKMYSNLGSSFINMEYVREKGIWVLKKFKLTSSLGLMGTSKLETNYKNIELNKGIDNKKFEIQN
jgi:outer membrane lipoprotein-sorting protein